MQMEIYAVQEAKGAQTRARAKFIEEGEKNTRYFLNLEKAQSNVKIMDRIKKGDGQVTTNQQEIIKEQVRFDSDRYRKTVDFQEPSAQAFSDGIDVPQLSDEQKTSIEGALTEEELTRALKRMKNGSSPGLDGITTAFIKFFWCKVKDTVLNSLNAAFTKGKMSIIQKRAVITLIHKGKQLPRDDLNNWRPISLTNSDYKLLAKSLAIRLSSVISSIINEDQVGFLKGRNISTVIRLIDDTINYLEKSERTLASTRL